MDGEAPSGARNLAIRGGRHPIQLNIEICEYISHITISKQMASVMCPVEDLVDIAPKTASPWTTLHASRHLH
eukprot:4842206-Heterocapsa_arctica.AAC.1